jgi:hypothetical protein
LKNLKYKTFFFFFFFFVIVVFLRFKRLSRNKSDLRFQGMYLRLSQGSTGECVRNPCIQDRLAPWTEGDKYTKDKTHCYEINTQGPCPDADQMFKVLPSDANIVGCFSPAFSITQVTTALNKIIFKLIILFSYKFTS